MIELRTLGTLDLRNGEELRSILAQPKRTGLLCYLALARPHGFHRRDKLLALFWPETDTEHGRASLRQAVRFLRRSLGEEAVLSRGDEELALGTGVVLCDARAFEEALAAGEIDRALALYGGDLLPGFYVEGAPELEHWLERERTRLRERAVAGAWALAEERERAHDGAGAAEWGRRASAMAPADDAGLRRLMQLLERLGDPNGALEVYHAGSRRLRLEFEVEPSRETQELGEEICERVRAAAAAPSAARAAPVNGAVLAPAPALPAVRVASAPAGPAKPAGGRRRRRVLWLSLALGVVGLGAAAGGWLLLPGRAGLQSGRVVVAPFDNRTGDASLAPLGEMAADWVAQGLSESGVVEVADERAARALSRESAGRPRELERRLARETGAGVIVTGRYYRHADSVAFLAQVLDARSGGVRGAIGPISAPTAAPVAAVQELRQRVLAQMAVLLDERVPDRGADFHVPTYEAYREFMQGVYRSEVLGETGEAAENYLRAFQLDTTFYQALLSASYAALMHGPRARYDSLQPALERLRDRLSPRQLRGLAWQHAYRDWNTNEMYALARAGSREHPTSDNTRFGLAVAAGRVHRYRESLAEMRRMDPDRPLTPKWYWTFMGGAHHVLGDYRGQLRAAAEMARRSPESVAPNAMRLVALSALGRTPEVRRLALALATRAVRDTMFFQEVGNIESLGVPPRAPPVSFFLAARELAAHDHGAGARLLVDDGLRWCALRPPAERADTAFRWIHAQLLVLAGRWREADAMLPQAPPQGWNPPLQWSRAMLAAQRGDRAGALAISQGLGRSPRPMLEFHRVSILAALGEREEARTRLRELLASGGFFGEWWVHTEPVLAPYLADPETQRLLRGDG